ncbi:hypothetical protein GDO78_004641 [Eleutherodactylus coqui]|uniref:Uncharacterized protein n=1 Tax=Eleutherodactylus coqui TaxID=57060 RepID=A0A8J6K009_ELECQ|nr:hypothetical protein GDO78_004641 [Eleutherodactylus coqui]
MVPQWLPQSVIASLGSVPNTSREALGVYVKLYPQGSIWPLYRNTQQTVFSYTEGHREKRNRSRCICFSILDSKGGEFCKCGHTHSNGVYCSYSLNSL